MIIKVFVIGSINMDLVVMTKFFPQDEETITGERFFTNPGGKGANQAVAIAKMGLPVEMVGTIGKEFGDELFNTLHSYNISTKHVTKLDNISSGTATIIVSNGDNRIILNPAANYEITRAAVDLALKDAKPGDFMLCQLEIPLAIVEYALKAGKAKGLITFLNPAPAATIKPHMFSFIDYFMPNQTESELYTNIYPTDVESAAKVVNTLLLRGVKNVLVTLGAEGSYFGNNEEKHFEKALVVPTIDTTGAGDTYIGTFLTMIAEGKTIPNAMRLATLAASITVQRMGAQIAIPYRNELNEK